MPLAINRKKIDKTITSSSIQEIEDKMLFRLKEKGDGTFSSRHEILGIIAEEYFELIEAVKSGTLEQVKEELKDIAVGCAFGIASIEAKGVEW